MEFKQCLNELISTAVVISAVWLVILVLWSIILVKCTKHGLVNQNAKHGLDFMESINNKLENMSQFIEMHQQTVSPRVMDLALGSSNPLQTDTHTNTNTQTQTHTNTRTQTADKEITISSNLQHRANISNSMLNEARIISNNSNNNMSNDNNSNNINNNNNNSEHGSSNHKTNNSHSTNNTSNKNGSSNNNLNNIAKINTQDSYSIVFTSVQNSNTPTHGAGTPNKNAHNMIPNKINYFPIMSHNNGASFYSNNGSGSVKNSNMSKESTRDNLINNNNNNESIKNGKGSHLGIKEGLLHLQNVATSSLTSMDIGSDHTMDGIIMIDTHTHTHSSIMNNQHAQQSPQDPSRHTHTHTHLQMQDSNNDSQRPSVQIIYATDPMTEHPTIRDTDDSANGNLVDLPYSGHGMGGHAMGGLHGAVTSLEMDEAMGLEVSNLNGTLNGDIEDTQHFIITVDNDDDDTQMDMEERRIKYTDDSMLDSIVDRDHDVNTEFDDSRIDRDGDDDTNIGGKFMDDENDQMAYESEKFDYNSTIFSDDTVFNLDSGMSIDFAQNTSILNSLNNITSNNNNGSGNGNNSGKNNGNNNGSINTNGNNNNSGNNNNNNNGNNKSKYGYSKPRLSTKLSKSQTTLSAQTRTHTKSQMSRMSRLSRISRNETQTAVNTLSALNEVTNDIEFSDNTSNLEIDNGHDNNNSSFCLDTGFNDDKNRTLFSTELVANMVTLTKEKSNSNDAKNNNIGNHNGNNSSENTSKKELTPNELLLSANNSNTKTNAKKYTSSVDLIFTDNLLGSNLRDFLGDSDQDHDNEIEISRTQTSTMNNHRQSLQLPETFRDKTADKHLHVHNRSFGLAIKHDSFDTMIIHDTSELARIVNKRDSFKSMEKSIDFSMTSTGPPPFSEVIINNFIKDNYNTDNENNENDQKNNNNGSNSKTRKYATDEQCNSEDFMNEDIRHWTQKDVCQWLKNCLLCDNSISNEMIDKIILKFDTNLIAGHVLLVMDEELLETIGITKQHVQQKILNFMKKLNLQ